MIFKNCCLKLWRNIRTNGGRLILCVSCQTHSISYIADCQRIFLADRFSIFPSCCKIIGNLHKTLHHSLCVISIDILTFLTFFFNVGSSIYIANKLTDRTILSTVSKLPVIINNHRKFCHNGSIIFFHNFNQAKKHLIEITICLCIFASIFYSQIINCFISSKDDSISVVDSTSCSSCRNLLFGAGNI